MIAETSKKRQYLLLADEDLISTDSGDAQALAALYDRHGRVAYSLAYRMMGERQAIEEFVQEVFLRASSSG